MVGASRLLTEPRSAVSRVGDYRYRYVLSPSALVGTRDAAWIGPVLEGLRYGAAVDQL